MQGQKSPNKLNFIFHWNSMPPFKTAYSSWPHVRIYGHQCIVSSGRRPFPTQNGGCSVGKCSYRICLWFVPYILSNAELTLRLDLCRLACDSVLHTGVEGSFLKEDYRKHLFYFPASPDLYSRKCIACWICTSSPLVLSYPLLDVVVLL